MSEDLENSIILIGQTGSGKSSTIGIMQNSELFGEVLEQGIALTGDISSIHGCIKIGQEIMTAATTLPDFVMLDKGLYVCDTPGFGDDRGAWKFEQDFVNAFYI